MIDIFEYKDLIKYISCSGDKDKFGYSESEPEERYVRYCGGKEAYEPKNNILSTEYRLIYHCPFEVKANDKFVINGEERLVKKSSRTPDVFGNTVYWRVEVV